jgi:hypothetical protein
MGMLLWALRHRHNNKRLRSQTSLLMGVHAHTHIVCMRMRASARAHQRCVVLLSQQLSGGHEEGLVAWRGLEGGGDQHVKNTG